MLIRRYFTWLILFLALMNFAILLDIPGLRQVTIFPILTILPGWLILQILRLHKLEFLKKIVLAVGLSIAFLMFGGLLLNYLYPLVSRPLSLGPLLISFNVVILILLFLAYWRNRNNFNITSPFDYRISIRNRTLSMILFPIFFPLLAILGTYLMNTQQNNVILMIMLGLIPAYIIALVMLKDRTAPYIYPLAVWSIALSLLLMYGLTSNYIMGSDIFAEYYYFQLAANNAYWDISSISNNYDTCLSVTILPAIYNVFFNVNPKYIFKVVAALIISASPVVLYVIVKAYWGHLRGLLCTLLFIFQFAFFSTFMNATRSGIALLFVGLVVLALFDKDITGPRKTGLFIIFGASAIVSHYSTGYTLAIWLFALVSILFIFKLLSRKTATLGAEVTTPLVTFGGSALFFCILFLWYSQVTGVAFEGGVNFVKKAFQNLIYFASLEMKQAQVGMLFGVGIESIPSFIVMVSHDIIFILITVGVVAMLRNYKKYQEEGFHKEYILSAVIFFAVLVALIIVPYVSKHYDTGRPFVTSLFFLTPAFIIGVEVVAKTIRRLHWSRMILCLLLLLQYTCVLHLPYYIFKMPMSMYYTVSGPLRDEYYIYDDELSGAKWFYYNGNHPSIIYGDHRSWYRLALAAGTDNKMFQVGFIDKSISEIEFKLLLRFTNKPLGSGGYIYLRHANVAGGIIYLNRYITASISEYADIFSYSNRVYANKGSEIWYKK